MDNVYTSAFVASLAARVKALPLVQGVAEFDEDGFTRLPGEKMLAFSARIIAAKAAHDAQNKVPENAAMGRAFTGELLSDYPLTREALIASLASLLAELDPAEFAENWSLLRGEVQKAVGLVSFGEKEFHELLSAALREKGKMCPLLARRLCDFLTDIQEPDCNFSATYKKFRFSLSFANVLKGGGKVQNLRFGITKEETEKSTLTLAEALEAIANGETPYAIVSPPPKPAKKK